MKLLLPECIELPIYPHISHPHGQMVEKQNYRPSQSPFSILGATGHHRVRIITIGRDSNLDLYLAKNTQLKHADSLPKGLPISAIHCRLVYVLPLIRLCEGFLTWVCNNH